MTTRQFTLGFGPATEAETEAEPADPAGQGGFREASLRDERSKPALPSTGPRLRFFATGGLLEAERVDDRGALPTLEYPKPPPFMRRHPGFGDPDEGPEEERIGGLVEHAAEVLFTARHEAALLDTVARRLERSGAGGPDALPPHRLDAIDLLRREMAEANRFYAECLEDYRSAMGDAAANELDAWLDRIVAHA